MISKSLLYEELGLEFGVGDTRIYPFLVHISILNGFGGAFSFGF